jgi:hypothetical protein
VTCASVRISLLCIPVYVVAIVVVILLPLYCYVNQLVVLSRLQLLIEFHCPIRIVPTAKRSEGMLLQYCNKNIEYVMLRSANR